MGKVISFYFNVYKTYLNGIPRENVRIYDVLIRDNDKLEIKCVKFKMFDYSMKVKDYKVSDVKSANPPNDYLNSMLDNIFIQCGDDVIACECRIPSIDEEDWDEDDEDMVENICSIFGENKRKFQWITPGYVFDKDEHAEGTESMAALNTSKGRDDIYKLITKCKNTVEKDYSKVVFVTDNYYIKMFSLDFGICGEPNVTWFPAFSSK